MNLHLMHSFFSFKKKEGTPPLKIPNTFNREYNVVSKFSYTDIILVENN